MNTNSAVPPSISPEEAQTTFAQQLASLDPQRAQGLAGLNRARAAKSAMLAREQRRTAQKYGAQSPRVASLGAQRTLNEKLRAEVAYRASLAGMSPPAADPQGYTCHGHVLDADRHPQSGLTVALYNHRLGVWLAQVGFSCTDAQGYFRLDYKQPQPAPAATPAPAPTPAAAPAATAVAAPILVAAPPAQPSAAGPAPPPGPSEARGSSTQDAALPASLTAEIRVYDRQQNLRYRSPETELLQPRLGPADYRLILLSPGGTCAPPP